MSDGRGRVPKRQRVDEADAEVEKVVPPEKAVR